MARDLVTLQREIDLLEKQKVELRPDVEELRADNDRLDALLGEVERGVLFGIAWRKIALAALIVVGAGVLTARVAGQGADEGARQAPKLNRLTHTMQPLLLVTSEPTGAEVRFIGTPKVGATPLIEPTPAGGFSLEIRAEGYHPLLRFLLETEPRRGWHVHVELQRKAPVKRPSHRRGPKLPAETKIEIIRGHKTAPSP